MFVQGSVTGGPGLFVSIQLQPKSLIKQEGSQSVTESSEHKEVFISHFKSVCSRKHKEEARHLTLTCLTVARLNTACYCLFT